MWQGDTPTAANQSLISTAISVRNCLLPSNTSRYYRHGNRYQTEKHENTESLEYYNSMIAIMSRE